MSLRSVRCTCNGHKLCLSVGDLTESGFKKKNWVGFFTFHYFKWILLLQNSSLLNFRKCQFMSVHYLCVEFELRFDSCWEPFHYCQYLCLLERLSSSCMCYLPWYSDDSYKLSFYGIALFNWDKCLHRRCVFSSECPTPVPVLPIVLGVIAGIILIGLLLLLLWKLLVTIHDRREYARFEKERDNARWNLVRFVCASLCVHHNCMAIGGLILNWRFLNILFWRKLAIKFEDAQIPENFSQLAPTAVCVYDTFHLIEEKL